jgi:hypothetical protein
MKDHTMKRNHSTALGAIALLGLGLAASAAIAHSDGMQGATAEGMGHGMHGQGMHGQGMHGAMAGGQHGGGKHSDSAHGLMTPAEREALHEKMRAAKTPEEKQALAATTRAEMEKRAKEKGIALPEQHGRGSHRH